MAAQANSEKARANRSTGSKSAAAAGTAEGVPAASTPTAEQSPHTHSATVRLPFMHAHFELPRLRPPRAAASRLAALGQRARLGPVTLPAPSKTVYYVGLGALAVAEVVEWPIAAAIAAGTYVAQHTRADRPATPQMEHASGVGGPNGAGSKSDAAS